MKTNLLVVNASARVTRSVTRQLAARLASAWQGAHPEGCIVSRDIGLEPPAAIDEAWIAAAYTPAEARTAGQHASLSLSETLIAEIEAADVIVIGTPLYNFGMPAVLKSWIEQIVRVGRTFEIVTSAEGESYRPLLAPKPVVVVVSAGNGAFLPGGEHAGLNFLVPHLGHMLGFLGLTETTFVQVEEAAAKQSDDWPELAVAEDLMRSSIRHVSPGQRGRVAMETAPSAH
ncbi:MAG: hypothetical protein K0R17_1499 [Rariglobus sp.]|jgi:FMN-dependent NADH-azoreductase|nr:hypothetical protein [Rariglobus sp.]